MRARLHPRQRVARMAQLVGLLLFPGQALARWLLASLLPLHEWKRLSWAHRLLRVWRAPARAQFRRRLAASLVAA
jgi:hypothetical protein